MGNMKLMDLRCEYERNPLGIHRTNTLLPLIVPPAATGFGVYWMKNYIGSNFPKELMESARIDGASEPKILFSVAVPCIKPAIATLGLMNFVTNWNSFLVPLIVLNKSETYTVPIGIINLNSAYRNDLAAKITALSIGIVPRLILKDSLDQIFAGKLEHNMDSCESKVFGLGTESYVPGSNEFYTEYAAHTGNCIVCMDAGHFHPTETIGPKFTSYLAFGDEIQLHVSRPVRWDSDHVVILDDPTKEIMEEIAAYDAYDKVHIGTDYFDASINRIAATAIGARAERRALMLAMLRPMEELRKPEREGNTTRRLALLEETKLLPVGFVWEYYCQTQGIAGMEWIRELVTR